MNCLQPARSKEELLALNSPYPRFVMIIIILDLFTTSNFIVLFVKVEQEFQLKKVLVRFFSHELRSPLNAMLLGLRYLGDQLRSGSSTIAELLETVMDVKFSCGQSVSILDQLLTYNAIISGKLALSKTKFAVLPLIRDVIMEFSRQV